MKKLLCVLLAGVSPKEVKYDSITIGGAALSEFKSVYANGFLASLKADNPGKYDVGESAYAELTARKLSDVLEDMTGVKVPVVATTEEVGGHEILIGRTNRSESVKVMNAVDNQTFSIKMDGGKLCIAGGGSAANYHALDKLYEYFASQNSKNGPMLKAAPNADITLIMLGTNDSDRFKDWKQADTDQYTKDYTDMLDAYLNDKEDELLTK